MKAKIKLKFLGAARNVTGSCYVVEGNGSTVMVDCGLYQEWKLKPRNWERFAVPPASIDAVLLTHAHLDHCGRLPKLVKDGFRGKIYCTGAAAEIAKIVLLDSARLQEEDAAFKRKRHKREGRDGPRPVLPLYTTEDAEACLPLFEPIEYGQSFRIGEAMEVRFSNAGHILGSAMIRLRIDRNGDRRTLLFSGDAGRRDRPLLHDPADAPEADYVLIEATYGDRLHPAGNGVADALAKVINDTYEAGGNVIIPSFAIERAQELLYYLNELRLAERIPSVAVFLDSPMAVKVTEVFRRYPELLDADIAARLREGNSPFEFPGLSMVKTVEQFKALNTRKGTSVIIAGSGMVSGGRVKHHLAANIMRPESTVAFVGYQAAGTPGRSIVDGASEIRLLGEVYPIRARIVSIRGFSAHADRDELLGWLSALDRPPREVFVTHAEEDSAESFAQYLVEKTGWKISVPSYQDEVVLA